MPSQWLSTQQKCEKKNQKNKLSQRGWLQAVSNAPPPPEKNPWQVALPPWDDDAHGAERVRQDVKKHALQHSQLITRRCSPGYITYWYLSTCRYRYFWNFCKKQISRAMAEISAVVGHGKEKKEEILHYCIYTYLDWYGRTSRHISDNGQSVTLSSVCVPQNQCCGPAYFFVYFFIFYFFLRIRI